MKQMAPELKRLVDDVTKQLIDEGRLIEAGWRGLRAMAIKPDAPEVQLSEMRLAFFAGAQHLFGSLMGALGREAEPAEEDMGRLDMISKELGQFIDEFERCVEQRTGRRA